MNIDEENKAKEFYIKSSINGIHTPRTNMVEINYLDMIKLMHSYSQEVVKNLSISGVVVPKGTLCKHTDKYDNDVRKYVAEINRWYCPNCDELA